MNSRQIQEMVALGEGYRIEFKERIPSKTRELAEEVCAFANAEGGTLIIGVNDDNQITGLEISNSNLSRVQDGLGVISPKLNLDIYPVEVEGKDLIVVEVPSGSAKPHLLSGVPYLRISPNSQKITDPEEIRSFFQRSVKLYFDEGACHEFQYPEDFDEGAFHEFMHYAKLRASLSQDTLLQNLKCWSKDGHFKNGAVLFFGKNPEAFFDTAQIRCVAFRGMDKRYIRDDKFMTGPLFTQYLKTMDWIREKLNVSYDIEGQAGGPRVENWEIPEIVFKEALVNALSHRDYYERGAMITVELFSDRIEIVNPGGLISTIKPADFGRRSMSRNPLIFDLFYRMNMVEKIGSGVSRIQAALDEYKLSTPTFLYDGMFSVTFDRPVDFDAWLDSWKEELTENRIKILELIFDDGMITKEIMAEKSGLSTTTIDNNLTFMRKLEVVQRIGSRKNGFWKISFKKKNS